MKIGEVWRPTRFYKSMCEELAEKFPKSVHISDDKFRNVKITHMYTLDDGLEMIGFSFMPSSGEGGSADRENFLKHFEKVYD